MRGCIAWRRLLTILAAMLAAGTTGVSGAGAAEPLVIEGAQMAGISGFRAYWDRPVVLAADGATKLKDHGNNGKGLVADWSTDQPGAAVCDAIHRRLLLRFPGAAAAIAAELGKGQTLAKVEVLLPFVDTEFFPLDYLLPDGMSFLGDLWVRERPTWHVVAWALRRPWAADTTSGPTWNASVNGRCYWARFGAQDERTDRFPRQFGPAEVSYKVTEGRLDVTALLTDAAFGATPAERLRRFSDCGLLLAKGETYDARFNHGGYEYGGAPGHRGIRVGAPRLAVTFAPPPAGQAAPPVGTLPPPADLAALPKSGAPTAALPSAEQLATHLAAFAFRQPPDMPDWQWQRVRELFALAKAEGGFPTTPEAYAKWLDHLLAMPYRMFRGHHTPLSTHTYLLYEKAMPEPVREHLRRYWEAWLMPGRPYTELQHNQWGIWTKPENNYYARTGDWRGNHSFYRDSYCRFMSTMNFNHLAAMGALLGGSIIGDQAAMDDGRYGLEHYLLRLWAWYDGTTQESIDHYYLGLTLAGQKSFADLGPTPLDRLIGKNMLAKTMDELVSCYHPALRRFIATSCRTGVAEMLGINEGVNHIVHTVSQRGALHDVDNPSRLGMPLVGHDLPPDLVARQQLIGPWMPLWFGGIVDDKPLPFEMTAAYKVWGSHRELPLWKRSYLGRHYGLAGLDISANETVPVMAQWRRADTASANLQDIGTLLVRYGLNQTEFYDSLYHGTKQSNANGSVGMQGGPTFALQHRNKAVVLASPNREFKGHGRALPETITSLQTTVALANYQSERTWTILVDGKPLGELPARAKQGCRIALHDGVTYVGLIALPATDLGRTEEVLITDGGAPVDLQGGGKAAPTLLINSYNYYQTEKPFDRKAADWAAVDRAYGGFIIEVADVTEYASFAAFQQHLNDAKVATQWDAAAGVLALTYRSGADTVELGFRPEYEGDRTPSDRAFPYRRVNGAWPYLAPGMERESDLSAQGSVGRLAKNGATLRHQAGQMAYLLTEPKSGHYLFSNPLPDPQYLDLAVPGGLRVSADGRLGLAQVLVHAPANTIAVEYAVKPGQEGDDMATALFIAGYMTTPTLTLNGAPVKNARTLKTSAGELLVLPLAPAAGQAAEADLIARYTRSRAAEAAAVTVRQDAQAVMRYAKGQEHYLLTEPRSGAFAFTRLWPSPSAIAASIPGGMNVATDGAIALQRLTLSAKENRVELDFAPYMQVEKDGQPLKDRATCLVVFGPAKAPTARLHGAEFAGPATAVTVAGQPGWLIPLFGADPATLTAGLEARLAAAKATLP